LSRKNKQKKSETPGQILDAALRAKQRLVNIGKFADHLDSLWNFNVWKPKGRDIGFSDIDGITERYGRFLLIECKHPKVEVMEQSKAAKIMRESFLRLGVFTYVVIVGDAVTTEIAYVKAYTKPAVFDIVPTLEGIRSLVGDWHTWAYKNKHRQSLIYTPCDSIVVCPKIQDRREEIEGIEADEGSTESAG
jgi:hypothetical protein